MRADGFLVRKVLRLKGSHTIGWAAFDPGWYLMAYPAVLPEVYDHCPAAILQFYTEHGQGLGHSPNIYFDEQWHRRRYPRVAEAVRIGRVASAFDAYCRYGFHGRSPHWLFDEFFYRTHHTDVTEAYLASEGLANGYDHYLRHGDRSGRSGHLLFDPMTYAAQLDPDERREANEQGCFAHYLKSLAAQHPERRTSIYFDPSRHPDVRKKDPAPSNREGWLGALHHYLANETPRDFDPLPEFSENYYLSRYGDVAEAVEAGRYRNGYEHFLAEGRGELRAPTSLLDLANYASSLQAAGDLGDGRSIDAFEHYLTFGRDGPRLGASGEGVITEGSAKLLFRRRGEILLPSLGRRKLDYSCQDQPDLSVFIILHDQFSLTLTALSSLRENFGGAIELFIIDSGSTDESRNIDQYVSGAHVLRFDGNIGYLSGCNAGLQLSTADFVLYLNNDVELAPDAVGAALRRLKACPGVGAVGGKIVRSHGLLQEAGCINWRDGSTSGYLRGRSPLLAEANFVRKVDYCSGVFLMVRGDIARQLDGFDEIFDPAYYEDTDLCVRITQAGYDVVYDPSVMVFHLEHGSAEGSGAPTTQMDHNRHLFSQKHKAYLQERPIRDDQHQIVSRFADVSAKRVLLIEDTIPLRSIGSGFVRSNDLIQTMASLGYQLTVFPINGSRFDVASVYRDMPDTVEVMHDDCIASLPGFLADRKDYFDAVWIARTHNLNGVGPLLSSALAGVAKPPILVLDTEAIDAMREAGRRALAGEDAADLEAAIRRELKYSDFCKTIVVVSEEEAATLRNLGWDNVTVIGHMRTLTPTSGVFAKRAGILFVGAVHRVESPNYDSLEWLVDQVLPIVEQTLGWRTQLTIVGYTAAGVSLEQFANHPRVLLRGPIGNVGSVYDQHRVFVAPTRYAAGQPYKVYEAASYGLPVVATELLRRQMNWENGRDLLSAESTDPELFAKQIVALYQDEELWQKIRTNALDRLRTENSREQYVEAIERVLGDRDMPSAERSY
jgi:O-antigen biosynthesis protein